MKFLLAVLLLIAASIAQTTRNCPSEDALTERFNVLSEQLGVTDCDEPGTTCRMQDVDPHGTTSSVNRSSCENIYTLCRSVILSLNLTTEECLEEHGHNDSSHSTSSATDAEVYGYGVLMVLFVSLCSLLGVFLVPLISSNSKVGRLTYEYVYAFMVAIGLSALISDAVLHLIPHAYGLHDDTHEEAGDGHDHGASSNEEESQDFIWKGCLVLLGAYAFFLLEVALHGLLDIAMKKSTGEKHHEHGHHDSIEHGHNSSEMATITSYSKKISNKDGTVAADNENAGVVKVTHSKGCNRIKPVAWLVTIGDTVHNFADGLALGAAIAQSLTLGVSTMFALIFHEIPHEMGDYVILVRSGIHWAAALILNFLSALTAIIGFFIGVAISTNSEQANGWILSITAGLFIYIAMTDLLPELIHGGENIKETKNGWKLALRFCLANLGFFISFALLLLLAIYESRLNELIG